MAWSFVQKTASPVSGKSITSAAPALPVNATVGNVVLLLLSFKQGVTAGATSVTGLGATWTKVLSVVPSAINNGGELWGAVVVSAGTSVTANFASSTVGADLAEYSGGTLTTDGTNSHQQASGASVAPGSITTVNASDLIISLANSASATAVTAPGAPWIELNNFGTSGGGGSTNIKCDSVYQIVSSTGTFNPSYTVASGGASMALIVALQAAATVNPTLPLPLYARRHGRIRPVIVRNKRAVKTGIFLERIPQAPFPNFPEQIRRRQQPKRIPRVKALRPHPSELNRVLIPPRPFPEFPVEIRRRQQPKRLPRVKAKRRVYGTVLSPPPPPPSEPPPVRHKGQQHRLVRVKAKRRVYGTLFHSPPQVPPAPLTVRRGLAQKKRLPRVKAKRRVYGTVLLIPQAPVVVSASLPLPILTRRLRRILARVKPKRVGRGRLPVIVAPTNLPLPILNRRQLRRLAKLKPVKVRTAKGSVVIFTPTVVPVSPSVAIVIWRAREGY